MESGREPVILPDLDRREIVEPEIDTEDFEISLFAGALSIEDFGTNPVYGARLDYHLSEDFFLQVDAGYSRASKTSYELLSGSAQLLTDDERDFTYYNFSLGYNLLPGEVFIGKGRAFNSHLYLIGGVGNVTFAGDDHFSANLGLGYRFLFTDAFALHLDVRDHLFNSDLLGEDKTTHNLELSAGLSLFF
ncbi:MAG: outer membrane beta-barrel domain-containing protein [gamma proteobacterium endosymbiont of Lamellibrachia anaximandri]|nr:outer membrane beta-barrel domain-containing protein [gamma proteobacterium endosymbiont of Lamellibrachia anaximandri]MBL3534888.1 outer membrane beta-barrel domain-containing protein [gamma proteobacterium endosymbiont of Lamellibrachia anaximandri]MBL3600796.1 outer membrane beta-barrel domain-containing protein [gamma proteobacterium endosymbiont of Lamellibrachia anaximandri]